MPGSLLAGAIHAAQRHLHQHAQALAAAAVQAQVALQQGAVQLFGGAAQRGRHRTGGGIEQPGQVGQGFFLLAGRHRGDARHRQVQDQAVGFAAAGAPPRRLTGMQTQQLRVFPACVARHGEEVEVEVGSHG